MPGSDDAYAGTELPEEQTSVPSVEDTPPSEPVADSAAGVVEKLLAGRLSMTPSTLGTVGVLVWVVVIGWMFLQDNGAGRLSGWEGVQWFLVKASLVTLLVGLTVGGTAGIIWYRRKK